MSSTAAVAARPRSGWLTPPRWGTVRTRRATDGPLVATVAEVMGYRLTDDQKRVFDTALERKGEKYVYDVVGLAIPRQNGKSLSLSLRIALELQRRNARVIFTSTDRGFAVERWRELTEILEESGFAPHIKKVRKVIGGESLTCHNGASFKPVTPSARAAGRGQSAVSLAIVDEVAQLRDFGTMGALLPTQLTVESSQLWLASTPGESPIDAPVWDHYTRLGRAAVLDKQATMAWFEWAPDCDPSADDFDPGNVDYWYQAIPMLRAGLITEHKVRSIYETTPREEFCREILGIWGTDVNSLVIAPDEWLACLRPEVEVDGNRLTMAIDAAPNNEAASISCATHYDSEPVTAVEVVEARGGTNWLVERTVELAKKWRPPHVAVDSSSPAHAFADQIEAKGVKVERRTRRDFAGACGLFASAVTDGTLAHIGQTPLDEAIPGATKTQLGDVWVFNRRKGYNISPLCSAALALGEALIRPAKKKGRID